MVIPVRFLPHDTFAYAFLFSQQKKEIYDHHVRSLDDYYLPLSVCPSIHPMDGHYTASERKRKEGFEEIKKKPGLLVTRHESVARSNYYANHKKSRTCVHIYIISKRIELEGPSCSQFKAH